jgi:uncharacterized protein
MDTLEAIIGNIVLDLQLSRPAVVNTVQMMSQGDTIPFISRYRKERTGGLDETRIRNIGEKLAYYTELEERKETVLKTIKDQGKLTAALEKEIVACREKQKLEDMYLPYKPKRTTRASIAREKGLGPLADIILAQEIMKGDKQAIIAEYVNGEKGITTPDQALAGALDIVSEQISDNADVRGSLRDCLLSFGAVKSRVRKEWEGKKTKFEMYYEYSEAVKSIPSHRLLAIRRGAKEEVLTWKIEVEDEKAIELIRQKVAKNNRSLFYPELWTAMENCYAKSLHPSLQLEVFCAKIEESDKDAISVFAKNATNLLLAPPAGHKVIMGVDPGFRTGCKVAVIDGNGNFREYHPIFPHDPQNRKEEAEKVLLGLIEKYRVELIAIGNGTASKETDQFIRGMIKKHGLSARSIVVSEAGASVYSASPLAVAEFPELDVTVRGAISIARRLQDPLAELVKIDPKSIGVGQYQHDVNQFELKKSLDGTVESCVNFVGANLNSASSELLSYVAGIGRFLAKNIVSYRTLKGSFKDKKELLGVPRFGQKAFEQCAGFLRIPGGATPLDNSAIHPESYPIVEKMAADQNLPVDRLVGNAAAIAKIDPQKYVTGTVGLPTLNDIIQELKKPGVDPRKDFSSIEFSADINDLSDLQENMTLEGTVTNVTNFGAFVDVGVHQDGLVHISKLSDRYVRDPHEVVAVGDRVRVRVLKVDLDLKRISLEMAGRV